MTAGASSSPLAIEASLSSNKQTVKTPSSLKSVVAPSVESITSHNSVHFNPDGAPLTAEEITEHFNRERRICPENSRFKKPLTPVMDRRKFVSSAPANRVVICSILSLFFQTDFFATPYAIWRYKHQDFII